MKSSEIRFKIELDDDNFPEKIFWNASDGSSKGLEEAKAITLSIWDHFQKETLRIDLWGKDMPIDEMKRFYIDTIGGLANSLRSSTNDTFMADEMEKLCDKLVKHLQNEQDGNQ
ncbi:MAG: gliding motility protein GldC [Bacteroidota bacterium]